MNSILASSIPVRWCQLIKRKGKEMQVFFSQSYKHVITFQKSLNSKYWSLQIFSKSAHQEQPANATVSPCFSPLRAFRQEETGPRRRGAKRNGCVTHQIQRRKLFGSVNDNLKRLSRPKTTSAKISLPCFQVSLGYLS